MFWCWCLWLCYNFNISLWDCPNCMFYILYPPCAGYVAGLVRLGWTTYKKKRRVSWRQHILTGESAYCLENTQNVHPPPPKPVGDYVEFTKHSQDLHIPQDLWGIMHNDQYKIPPKCEHSPRPAEDNACRLWNVHSSFFIDELCAHSPWGLDHCYTY